MAGRLLAETPGVHLHTHLAENHEELAAVRRLYLDWKPIILRYYEKFGLATPQSVFAHCLHLCRTRNGRGYQCEDGFECRLLSDLQPVPGQRLVQTCAAAEKAAGWMSVPRHRCRRRTQPVAAADHERRPIRRCCQPCAITRWMGSNLFHLATLAAARALRLSTIMSGNFASGKEADFIVLDAKQAPAAGASACSMPKNWAEKLFAFAMLVATTAPWRALMSRGVGV